MGFLFKLCPSVEIMEKQNTSKQGNKLEIVMEETYLWIFVSNTSQLYIVSGECRKAVKTGNQIPKKSVIEKVILKLYKALIMPHLKNGKEA
jgi:hypothetical protein